MTGLRLGPALALGLLLLPQGDCRERKSPEAPAAKALAAPAPDAFAGSVRPVLQSRCAPCHETGGQMYDRMPFDDAAVVASHRVGVLRRLKDADREAVEKWLESLPEKDGGL